MQEELKKIDLLLFSQPMQSEEEEIDWIQRVVDGGNRLIRYLQYSQVYNLKMIVLWDDEIISCPLERHIQLTTSSLQQTVKSVNLERTKKNLQTLHLDVG